MSICEAVREPLGRCESTAGWVGRLSDSGNGLVAGVQAVPTVTCTPASLSIERVGLTTKPVPKSKTFLHSVSDVNACLKKITTSSSCADRLPAHFWAMFRNVQWVEAGCRCSLYQEHFIDKRLYIVNSVSAERQCCPSLPPFSYCHILSVPSNTVL